MAVYVTDTHPLLWFTSGKHRKLSPRALRAFRNAKAGKSLIHIPLPVLWEAILLLRRGRIRLETSFEVWSSAVTALPGFDLAPMDLGTLIETQRFPVNEDPFDAAIVATARLLEFPLITADSSITDSNAVEIYW